MKRAWSTAVVGALLVASAQSWAQGGRIERAVVHKIDLDGLKLTLRVGKVEREFQITEATQVLGVTAPSVRERFQGVKEGVAVMFKAVKKDQLEILIALKLDDQRPTFKTVDSSKLVPLTELGRKEYQGYTGGLYPAGKNERPAAHEQAGLRLAKQIQPLDRDGKPDAAGKIVLLSIGMSNTSQASQGFARHLAQATDKNPKFLFVNGAQGGMTAAAIQDPDDGGRGTQYWTVVDKLLEKSNVGRAQVQAVWIKQADAGPKQGFPQYAKTLEAELAKIVQILPQRFPNIKLAYLSSRTYGGFATTPLNPEPYAYESGFSVQWLIKKQLDGDQALNFDAARGKVTAPWLSWGPYLWANGTAKRADGFYYESSDFAKDGTHHSPAGQDKIGRHILDWFRADATAQRWFFVK